MVQQPNEAPSSLFTPPPPPLVASDDNMPSLCLAYREGEGESRGSLEILATISPPDDVVNERGGCDLCCVGKFKQSIFIFAAVPHNRPRVD